MVTTTIERQSEYARSLSSPPLVPAQAASLRTRTLTSLADIEGIARDWRRLEQAAATPVVFQSYEWCRYVMGALAAIGMAPRPHVVVVYGHHQPVAILPLKIERSMSIRVVTDLTDPFSQYSDVLIAPGHPAAPILDALVAALRQLPADAIVLRKVRADSPLHPVLAMHFKASAGGEAAAAIEFAASEDFDAFYKTVKAKTRKNIRNARHRFERVGTLSHSVEQEPAAIRRALLGAVGFRRDWLEDKGLSSRAFVHRGFAALIDGLAETQSHNVRLMVMTLSCNGEPAAMQWGLVHNGRYYGYMAGKNQAFDAHSPGKLHLDYIVRSAFEAGVSCVDLMAPAMTYKLCWANSVVAIDDFSLPLTPAGWIATRLSQGNMRRLVKRACLRVPEGIRRPFLKALRSHGAGTANTAVETADEER